MYLVEMGNIVPEMDLGMVGGDDQMGNAAIRDGILHDIVRRSALNLSEERPDDATMTHHGDALTVVPLDDAQECRVHAFMEADPVIAARPPKADIIGIFTHRQQLGKLFEHLLQGQALGETKVHFRETGHDFRCLSRRQADLVRGIASPLQWTGDQRIEWHVAHVFADSPGLHFTQRIERNIGQSHQQPVDVGLGLAVTDQQQGGFTPRWMPEEIQDPLWCGLVRVVGSSHSGT